LHVWSLGDTKYFEENQNVLFMSENARQDLCEKMRIRVSILGFSNYASFYFDYSRMRIKDLYIIRLFISQKISAHKYTWLKAINSR
jgi:hypothetical protein